MSWANREQSATCWGVCLQFNTTRSLETCFCAELFSFATLLLTGRSSQPWIIEAKSKRKWPSSFQWMEVSSCFFIRRRRRLRCRETTFHFQPQTEKGPASEAARLRGRCWGCCCDLGHLSQTCIPARRGRKSHKRQESRGENYCASKRKEEREDGKATWRRWIVLPGFSFSFFLFRHCREIEHLHTLQRLHLAHCIPSRKVPITIRERLSLSQALWLSKTTFKWKFAFRFRSRILAG